MNSKATTVGSTIVVEPNRDPGRPLSRHYILYACRFAMSKIIMGNECMDRTPRDCSGILEACDFGTIEDASVDREADARARVPTGPSS